MASTPSQGFRPVRRLITFLVLIAALAGTIWAGTQFSDAAFTPKLALDLEGGTQIILTPVATDGAQITDQTINQAISVIRQRVDSSGVSETEITSQGGRNIVVSLPGKPDKATLDLVRQSAQMRFRPVLRVGAPQPVGTEVPAEELPTDTPVLPGEETPAGQEAPAGETPAEDGDVAPTDQAPDPAVSTPGATGASDGVDTAGLRLASHTVGAAVSPAPDPEGTVVEDGTPLQAPTEVDPGQGVTVPGEQTPLPDTGATGSGGAGTPSDLAQITPEIEARFAELDCTDPANLTGGGGDDPTAPLVTCDVDGTAKFILGPMEIAGTEIDRASSGLRVNAQGATTNTWVVNLEFTGKGRDQFRDVTARLATLTSPQNQFGIVLDGLVVSAPSVSEALPTGNAEISGTFNRTTAATLANQLNFGALPLDFRVQSESEISATLGSEQLEKGLLAGLIGLVLVVVYSLFQYRALGLVTVASLVVASIVTYGLITLLSWTQGYRLSLPGVAGLIVAIGITADSFIVYFERIRDELRDGRSLNSAVEKGWARAKRTILASDAVNFLAAVVLYFLAVGGVRGFAFTLGLTTLVDLLVVFLFTHPLMTLLARTRFFGSGHPWSGLDPRRLGGSGPRYAGRGRVVTTAQASAEASRGALVGAGVSAAGATGGTSAGGGQTIAERRAAARQAAEAERAIAAHEASEGGPAVESPPVEAGGRSDADRADAQATTASDGPDAGTAPTAAPSDDEKGND